jgi:uncharacterized protein with gpF-like domain
MTQIDPTKLEQGDFFRYNGKILQYINPSLNPSNPYHCRCIGESSFVNWELKNFAVYLLEQDELEELKARLV